MADRMTTGRDRLALGAALVTVVFWASAFVGIRALADDLSPGPIAFGRLAVALITLTPLLVRRGWQPMTRRDAVLVVASGLAWQTVYFVVLNQAERSVDAGTAAMLVNTGPIFIALLAGTFLGEGFPVRLVVGSLVAFAGSAIIGLATGSDAPAPGADVTLGIGLCIVAALSYAVGVTLQKPALRNVSPLQLTWTATAVATVATLPFAPTLMAELGRSGPDALAWVGFLGLFPTAIAFTTWSFALSRTAAGRLGSTTYLVPVVAIILGWLVLREVPAPLALLGGALCIGGVIVARTGGAIRWRRARPAEG